MGLYTFGVHNPLFSCNSIITWRSCVQIALPQPSTWKHWVIYPELSLVYRSICFILSIIYFMPWFLWVLRRTCSYFKKSWSNFHWYSCCIPSNVFINSSGVGSRSPSPTCLNTVSRSLHTDQQSMIIGSRSDSLVNALLRYAAVLRYLFMVSRPFADTVYLFAFPRPRPDSSSKPAYSSFFIIA